MKNVVESYENKIMLSQQSHLNFNKMYVTHER